MGKLGIDLSNSFNHDSGKILSQSTIEMITKGEYPEWQKKYQN